MIFKGSVIVAGFLMLWALSFTSGSAAAQSTFTPLGLLPGGVNSYALGVSADGAVVVGYSLPGEAFRWTQADGLVGLGDLPGGIFGSQAHGVSADGAVVVGRSYSALGLEAFRWTEADDMIGLGDLDGGRFLSIANGVSGDGAVVVG
jgi:probable HAF family extracellular repeat protein